MPNSNIIRKILLSNTRSPYDLDAEAFFVYMANIGDPVPVAYKTLYNSTITELKAVKGYDGITSLWDSSDVIRIEATYSKTAALKNLKRNGYGDATIFSDYGGSFTQDVGLTGNGSNFRVMTGFNPGDGLFVYKYTQNSAVQGIVVITDTTTGTGAHETAAFNVGSTQGSFLRPMNLQANNYRMDAELNSQTIGTGSGTTIKTKNQFENRRLNATNTSRYQSGVFIGTDAGNSVLVNSEYAEFCANSGGVFALFTTWLHSLWYAGNSNLSGNLLWSVIQNNFINPLNNSASKLDSRVIFKGDSMTGGQSLSALSEYPRKTLFYSGSNWTGVQLGTTNQTVATALTLVTEVTAFRNTYLKNDFVCMFQGTNDIGLLTGQATNCYNNTKSYGTAVKATGMRFVLCGIVDRRGVFAGGQNTAGFAVDRASVRANFLADFTVASGIPNVWLPGPGITYADAYIDLFADTIYTDATNTTYFQADLCHMTSTAYDHMASTYVSPIILQLQTP